jgi:hypothetical protein
MWDSGQMTILRQQFRHIPDVIGDTRFHGRRDSERAVELTEIVKAKMERDINRLLFHAATHPVTLPQPPSP